MMNPERELFLKETDSEDEHLHSESYQPYKRQRLCSQFLAIALTSFIWIILILSEIFNTTGLTLKPPGHHEEPNTRHNITSTAKLMTCGTTVAQAKSLGCKYDILLNNWVPAPCYDQEFIDEYQDDSSWTGFADKELTQKLSVTDMSEREFYYTSVRDHVNHCGMMWRKQFWSLFSDRRAVDTVVASPGHTDHCSQFLMDILDRNGTEPTRTEAGFAGCWIRG